jgi:transposase
VDTEVSGKIRNGGVEMERIPRGRYTKEFRLEAVKLVVEGKQSASEVARRLNISDNTLYNWIKAHR